MNLNSDQMRALSMAKLDQMREEILSIFMMNQMAGGNLLALSTSVLTKAGSGNFDFNEVEKAWATTLIGFGYGSALEDLENKLESLRNNA